MLVQLGGRRQSGPSDRQCKGEERSRRHRRHPTYGRSASNSRRDNPWRGWKASQGVLPDRADLAPPARVGILGRVSREGHRGARLRPAHGQVHGHQRARRTRQPQPGHLPHAPAARPRGVPDDAPLRPPRRLPPWLPVRHGRGHLLHHLPEDPAEGDPALPRRVVAGQDAEQDGRRHLPLRSGDRPKIAAQGHTGEGHRGAGRRLLAREDLLQLGQRSRHLPSPQSTSPPLLSRCHVG